LGKGKLCELSPTEETIIVNIKGKTRKRLAEVLGMEMSTLKSHIYRIRAKREAAKKLIRKTDAIKSELYPKRKGE